MTEPTLTELRDLDEYYSGEFDTMIEDTLDQLEQIKHNEIAVEPDLYGVDGATD